MTPQSDQPLPRVALIGITGYGSIHLQLARQCRDRGDLVIVAATVINTDEVPADVADLKAHGTEIFSDYEAMLAAYAGTLDLCLVPTGIHWHARMTIAALEAGANVLVEKPLSGVMAEVEAVRAAERAAERFVAVGFQDYYEARSAWLKQALLNGVIGKVETVRFLGVWPRARQYFHRNGWAGRLRLGEQAVFDSPLSNAFAHFAMLSLYLAGPALHEVAAASLTDGELYRAHEIESFDTAVVRLRTAGGVNLWFGASHASQLAIEPEIVITGSEGTAGWRYEREAWWTRRDGTSEREVVPDAHGARRAMMAATLRRLSDPETPICTTEIAAHHTQLIETLHNSIPVQDFAPEQVHWSASGESGIPTVDGLDEALQSAYQGGESLSAYRLFSSSPERNISK